MGANVGSAGVSGAVSSFARRWLAGRPIWPCKLQPQLHVMPSPVKASVCRPPHATCTQRRPCGSRRLGWCKLGGEHERPGGLSRSVQSRGEACRAKRNLRGQAGHRCCLRGEVWRKVRVRAHVWRGVVCMAGGSTAPPHVKSSPSIVHAAV